MYQVFYLMASFQNEPLSLVRVKVGLIKAYEKAIKGGQMYLAPAPTFEFYDDDVNLDKTTIETKADF